MNDYYDDNTWTSDDSGGEVERRHNRRTFRPRVDWEVRLSRQQFVKTFRLTPTHADVLLNYIGRDLEPTFYRNHALSPKQKLLIALRYYGGSGRFQDVLHAEHVSHGTVSKAVNSVSAAIIRRLYHLIDWPIALEDRRQIAADFFSLTRPGIPNVCGCIDGTLIRIEAPREHEYQFVDRHNTHSINCMGVCGPNYKLYAFSCRWPGSVHDARVFRNSELARRFDGGYRPFPNAIILADSAYPAKEWVLPMQVAPPARYVRLFQTHPLVRRTIEQTWAILKNRFSCLSNRLRCKTPLDAARIIKSCAILHNFLIDNRDNDDEFVEPEETEDLNDENVEAETSEENGEVVVNTLQQINDLFLRVNHIE